MASLAEQRAAIRAGISANFDSGKSAAASRRAIGAAMEASRRGTLKSDLNALESSPRKSGQLRTLERKGARPATSGVGVWNPARLPSSGGGGIASPLTEQTRLEDGVAIPDREFYEDAEAVMSSADGLLSFAVAPIKTTNFKDANGADEVRNYARPV